MFWARFLVSIADATFWLLIIAGISISIWFLFKKIAGYLLEEVENKEDEREEQ